MCLGKHYIPSKRKKGLLFQRVAFSASLYIWKKMAILALEPQQLSPLRPPTDQRSNVLFQILGIRIWLAKLAHVLSWSTQSLLKDLGQAELTCYRDLFSGERGNSQRKGGRLSRYLRKYLLQSL